MSLTTALNSAVSGLLATGRATELVSENVANASTPGYARRSLEVSSLVNGGRGVKTIAVQRQVDPALLANRRASDAGQATAAAVADFQARMQVMVGVPGEAGSLPDRLARFDAALIAAASRPDSAQRLDSAVSAAADLVAGLNQASDELTDLRSAADARIDRQVDRMNAALIEMRELNQQVTSVASSGGPIEGLLDQRQRLVDEINTILPVQVVPRPNDQVALFTKGGAGLLDGRAAELSFTPANLVGAEMTLAGGALSGLTLDGFALPVDEGSVHLEGGTLAGAFRVRDSAAPALQAELDQVAADLVQRFEAAGLDPTLAPGATGLLTDNGARYDAATLAGLAGRLEINAAVDPAQGGASWRLRDGLGAAMPGPPGEARLLQALQSALDAPRAQSSTLLGTGDKRAADLADALSSAVARRRNEADQGLAGANARQSEMRRAEAAGGVDTDQELQSLIALERAYGANARVIEVVDDMMQRLLRI